MRLSLGRRLSLIGIFCSLFAAIFASAAQVVHVTGGSTQNGIFEPFFYSWHYPVSVDGSGWNSGDTIHIFLHGPLNTPGISPTDREIGSFSADGGGAFNTTVTIPYDEGGAYTIPRPGRYQIVAQGDTTGSAFASDLINLAPATLKADFVGIDWSHERGGRNDVTGITKVFPEWMAVWDEQPVAMYATFKEIDNSAEDEPCVITHSDWPFTHYAHDCDLMVDPDPEYRWLMGTANFYQIQDPEPPREIRHMSVEWETQNPGTGDPTATGQGPIGLPLFAMPTADDRLYVVGRWILDAGHPDEGDRTEVHPPRVFAVIRNRPTVMPLTPGSSCMTYAKQVDVMVSGHGGGANRNYYSLSNTLGPGGRVQDVVDSLILPFYYANLPAVPCGLDVPPFVLNGDYNREDEFHAINDMDYDFDVPLPSPPAGATTPIIEVTKESMDTTSVNEVVTYTNPIAGLPTVAHIHLPCSGGDNGTYARRIKFGWDKYKAPGKHFIVQFNDIQVKDNSDPIGDGEWFMWAEACGEWINLSALNPDAFYDTGNSDDLGGLQAAHFDVYLDPNTSMHVMAEGYEQDHLDFDFGTGFDNGPTEDILGLAVAEGDLTNPGDNDELGQALIRINNPTKENTVGDYNVASTPTDKSYYDMRVKISYVPAPPRIELNGVPADFGNVCLNDFQDKVLEIFNVGEQDLEVDSINVTGDGFSRLGSPNVPFIVAGGSHVDITVRFNPSAISQGVGQIAFDTTDPCQPHIVFPLSGVVNYPKGTLSGSLSYGMLPVDDRTVGSSITKNFHVNNTGGCPLTVTGASVISAGTEFALGSLPSFPQTIQPGGSLSIPVVFNPTSQGAKSGTVQVNLGNDPTATNLTINMDGTGIVPFATATPTDTHFKPTVVGFSKTQTITLSNNGPAELIVDNIQMNGTGYSVAPVNLPVRLAPNASTNFTVTFAPQSVARRLDGSLVFTTNDPNHPTVTDTFCGEGVNCGFRLLVLKADGTPYATVDQITLASYGVKPSTNTMLKNAPLVTINPPTSCDVIQYQMEKMPLPSTDQANKRGSYYSLKAKVGSKSQTKSFTLAPSDFLEIVIKLQ